MRYTRAIVSSRISQTWHRQHTDFDGLLGTAAGREHTLNLEHLISPDANLHDLDSPFSMEEIWPTVKLMSVHKAPGPDGITVKFLHACWSTVRQDISTCSNSSSSSEGVASIALIKLC